MRKEGTRHIFCNIVACSGCSNSSVLFRERTFFLRFKRTWVLRKENGALCSIRHILAFEKVHCWRVQNFTPKAGIFPSYTLLQTQHIQSSPIVWVLIKVYFTKFNKNTKTLCNYYWDLEFSSWVSPPARVKGGGVGFGGPPPPRTPPPPPLPPQRHRCK